MLQIGSVLDGKYKILNEIGHGGMSVVYLALNERANKTWAVKEIRKDGGNDSEVVSQGLVAETEMLKKLNHPNLPSIVDVIDKSDTFIIVMDYIEGRSLQSVINHSGPQDPEKVLEWSKQLCDVLGYLHSRQPAIIYRDMKPANVMLKPDGQVALIDFGTAREYKEHSQGDTTWLGTRGYAAPEQFGGRGQTDARTDIYCLGATMYHLLTGYSPADTQFVIYPLGELVPAFAGSGLEKVVAKCCEPDPANRYQSCAELMYALEHVHDEDAVAIRERNRKWNLFIASCVLALIGLVGTVGFAIMGNAAEKNSSQHYISLAQQQDTWQGKAEFYAKAVEVKNDEVDAYEGMMDTITDAGSDDGRSITSAEHKSLQDLMDKYGANFRRSKRVEYAEFQYNRGARYLMDFNGNPGVTKSILEDIKDDSRLSDEQQKVANCIIAFCDIYMMNITQDAKAEESETNFADALAEESGTGTSSDYANLWNTITGLLSKPDQVDENTGGSKIMAATLYRETAKQVQKYYTGYHRAGVTDDQMLALLEAGKSYLNSTDTAGNESLKAMVAEALEQIDSAEHQLKQDKKTDLGAGTAPSENELKANTEESKEQGGGLNG